MIFALCGGALIIGVLIGYEIRDRIEQWHSRDVIRKPPARDTTPGAELWSNIGLRKLDSDFTDKRKTDQYAELRDSALEPYRRNGN